MGDSISELKKIETGVPQGGVLSPILFSIFINDIPIKNELLFADDLVTFFIYKQKGFLEGKIINLTVIILTYLTVIKQSFLALSLMKI